MSQMTLTSLRVNAHNRSCRVRAVSRLVSTDEFEAAYLQADATGQDAVLELIKKENYEGVKTWVYNIRASQDIAAMTLRKLRLLGQKLGVKDYYRLPKVLLLSEITNATK